MTVTVEAGCTLAALAHRLSEAGQWLPLDPPCPEETTVGGMIAANLSGPLRASQGTVRARHLASSWRMPSRYRLSSATIAWARGTSAAERSAALGSL